MEDKDIFPRSRSLNIIQDNAVLVRQQSEPFIACLDEHVCLTPIHQAESYKISTPECDLKNKMEIPGAKRVIETLLEPSNESTPSRHSAASLKVHFRSMDDISDEDLVQENEATEFSFGSRRRSHSEGTSWSMSESDITGPAVDLEDEDGNTPPDGGWGWVVVAASFVVNLIADGATFSFGVIYVELLQYFQESRGYTAWIGGLFMAIPLLSGPLASSLTDRYGCQIVTIIGSILAALGFILSSISNSLEVLFFTFGIISGFGLSLCYVAAIVIVAFYFEKRRSLATGLAVCGSGIGTFIFAPLTQYLIDEYGWRGTTLIVSGFFLNISVCGALMRSIEGSTKPRKACASTSSFGTGYRSRQCSESQFCATPEKLDGALSYPVCEINVKFQLCDSEMSDVRLCNSLINLPTFLCQGDKIPHEVLVTIMNNPQLYSAVLHTYPGVFERYMCDTKKQDSSEPNEQTECKFFVGDNRLDSASIPLRDNHPVVKEPHSHHSHHQPHHWNAAYLKGLRVKKRSLTYRGAMLNLPRYRLRTSSCPDIYRNSITTIAREKEGACWDYMEELREVLMDMVDISYLSNPRFVMFAISNALLYCCYHVPYVYMADWAIAKGHPEGDASFLLSVVGILNTLGEIILGFLGDRSWANATWIYAGCMLLCGLSTAAVPMLPSYTWVATASGLFGWSIAANYSLAAVILVDLISLERFVNAYGLLLLFQGVANLIGPPLAGWICDVTGSYDISFYIAGVVIVLSGFILVMLPLVKLLRFQLSVDGSNSDNHTDDEQAITNRMCCCFRKRTKGESYRSNKISTKL